MNFSVGVALTNLHIAYAPLREGYYANYCICKKHLYSIGNGVTEKHLSAK